MTSRLSFRPSRPDFDKFLFATVGEEINGIPLSVISALTRLGLDPWQEAGRLSSLSNREAVEQLARLIAELPDAPRPRGEARDIAVGLIGLLPRRDANRLSAPQLQTRPLFSTPLLPRPSYLWVVCFVLAAAVLLSAIFHGGLPFGIGRP
jgi:hypothetical protein